MNESSVIVLFVLLAVSAVYYFFRRSEKLERQLRERDLDLAQERLFHAYNGKDRKGRIDDINNHATPERISEQHSKAGGGDNKG
jgi:hypothetical protein